MVQVLKHIDPTPSAHRLRPVLRGFISTIVVSTWCGKDRCRKATPFIIPELYVISAEIKNSLFCSKTKEPNSRAQTNTYSSFLGTNCVALPSCDDDALAVGYCSVGKHISNAEAVSSFGKLAVLTLELAFVLLNLIW
ncbi:hypothetical protein BT93_L1759 [Corymbia citriodora subsp. variegata]|uniref:Uncharacterized protein n=1 Tax=Corymbia citriodora subsp. variegata TaxID=360336 RepID=A0A8T0CLX0_CORYI|nr:hypothetical protein BT93_L1759 [Corymbia citriodora subsp. variegata]